MIAPEPARPEDRARLANYAEVLAFYRGEQWPGRRQRGETRLTFNYARTLLRKVSSYVFSGPVSFSVPDRAAPGVAGLGRAHGHDTPRASHPSPGDTPGDAGGPDMVGGPVTGDRRRTGPGEAWDEDGDAVNADGAAATRAEAVLAALVADLDLPRLDAALCLDAAVTGDAALKVTWDPLAASGHGQPVVAAVDPASLVAWWAPDDPRRTVAIEHTYGLSGAALADLFGAAISPLGLDPGRTYPVVEAWTAGRWRVRVAGATVRDIPNPYGWIPYVVIPNNPRPHAYWGESDLLDLMPVCRELNARMSVLARILDLSGAPIAVLENVDGAEGITVGPGATWELPEGARAYLLDLLAGGGVGLHVEYVNLLYRTLHDLSETPRTAFGDSGRDLSGAALEVEIQPLVQKVGRKRRDWDAVFRARNARLLDLAERFGGEDLGGLRRTETIWPGVLPSDVAATVLNATRLVGHGIQSRRTAIAALGGTDPEAELGRILDEAARFGPPGMTGEASRSGTATSVPAGVGR
ncbi:MAG: phage portal protein [Thermomicrobiales bacterium]